MEDMCYERRQAEACVDGQTSPHSQALLPIRCVCLLLQDLLYSCVQGGEGDSEGHVL